MLGSKLIFLTTQRIQKRIIITLKSILKLSQTEIVVLFTFAAN